MTHHAGTAIFSWRRKRGWSQTELARRALLTQPNLSAIEAGRRDLSVSTLCRLARALGVEPGALLSRRSPRRQLGRHMMDATARAAITGKRPPGVDARLAAGLAWARLPAIEAAGEPGRRLASRHAWRLSQAEWDPDTLDRACERVNKLLASHGGWENPG